MAHPDPHIASELLALGSTRPQSLTIHHDLPYAPVSDVRRTLDV